MNNTLADELLADFGDEEDGEDDEEVDDNNNNNNNNQTSTDDKAEDEDIEAMLIDTTHINNVAQIIKVHNSAKLKNLLEVCNDIRPILYHF